MRVYGAEITEDQIAAGLSAMRDEFRMRNVVGALIRAGVDGNKAIAERAADRLLQRERRAGRIVAVNNKVWKARP